MITVKLSIRVDQLHAFDRAEFPWLGAAPTTPAGKELDDLPGGDALVMISIDVHEDGRAFVRGAGAPTPLGREAITVTADHPAMVEYDEASPCVIVEVEP